MTQKGLFIYYSDVTQGGKKKTFIEIDKVWLHHVQEYGSHLWEKTKTD